MLALDRFPVVGLHSEYIPSATGAQGTGAGGWATLRHGSGHSYKDIHLMNSGYFNSLSRHKTSSSPGINARTFCLYLRVVYDTNASYNVVNIN